MDPARTANAFLIEHVINPKTQEVFLYRGGGDVRQRYARVTGEGSGVRDRSHIRIEQRLLSGAFFGRTSVNLANPL